MDQKNILQLLSEELNEERLDCIFSSESDFDKLLIYTGLDKEKRMQIIQIRMTSKKIPTQAKKTDEKNLVLEFDSLLLFKVEDQALTDVAQFLHFLNLQLEIPGFYLNLIDNTIAYRYVLLAESKHIPNKIIRSLIGIIMFLQDVFSPTLERLARGKVTFIEMMEEIKEILSKIKS